MPRNEDADQGSGLTMPAGICELIDYRLQQGAEWDAPHKAEDQAKIEGLKASLRAQGWVGAPLVTAGCTAITGSHRIAALNAIWREDECEVEDVASVDICALGEAYGLEMEDFTVEYDSGWDVARIAEALPDDVVEYLGIQAG